MKIKKQIILLLFSSIFTCCTFNNEKPDDKEQTINETADNHQELYFKDLVDIKSIEKVLIRNNYGEIDLDEGQLDKIKSEMSKMKLYWCCPTKPGAITFEITINGKVYSGHSSTGSKLLFFDDLPIILEGFKYDGPDIYFEMPKGMNFDNYK